MQERFDHQVPKEHFIAAALRIDGIVVRATGSELEARAKEIYEEIQRGESGLNGERQKAIRQILRNGKYRPSGRGKPAQEYLNKVFTESGSLPRHETGADQHEASLMRDTQLTHPRVAV